ncbi:uncharacterized protein LOC110898075 isoform X2 [Helianthus annuus]|uniref:uncharacterized protein LOC110898075 isoform X2 n=1 Tax=Helianthus annuus TaxID=4232 RepID=UPI000B8FCC6E|nr:uncharacterized protein LOC110898075 isoform X2 [Helianthus annuus]
MSTTKKSSPKGQGKNKKGRLTDKAMSFHGRVSEDMVGKLTRPRTVPELVSGRSVVMTERVMTQPKLTKLLLNVTVQRSLGPVHVLISPEATVGDLIASALRQYLKEGLSRDAKLNELGSRNFFLCPKQSATIAGNGSGQGEPGACYDGMTTSSSTCSKEAEKATKGGAGWLRFMEFML